MLQSTLLIILPYTVSSQAAPFVEFKSALPRLQFEYLNVVQDCNLKNICSEVFFF